MDQLMQYIAALSTHAMLSPEAERIKHPKRNDKKYENYVIALKECDDFARETGSEIKFINPDFPMADHRVWLTMQTSEDEVDITEVKGKLATVLNNASSCIIDTNKENVRFFMTFEDIYTEREQS